MSHEIEQNADGSARFAYSITGGHPWHKLGTPMAGLGTIDEMLTAAQADYQVESRKVAAIDENGELLRNPDGSPVVIDDSRATIRVNPDGSFDGLATVGTRYVVMQNREVAERALTVVGASKGDAVVDTAGVLLDGKRFFMTIDLGSLVIDPAGINDRIARYLVVSCGHDGRWPIRYANTDIRGVCNNTVMLGIKEAQRVVTARHTKNADSVVDDARRVLEISVDWAKSFQIQAEQLLRIPVKLGTGEVDRVLNQVFPKKPGETDRQSRNRMNVNDKIRGLYSSTRNAGGFGQNGWSMYNAIGEYLDHHRDADPVDRAHASIDETSWVSQLKLRAQQAILDLR